MLRIELDTDVVAMAVSRPGLLSAAESLDCDTMEKAFKTIVESKLL